MAAKSQQRPLDFWFVMGAPSRSILMEKVCVMLRVDARVVRMDLASWVVRALRARRFY